MKRYLASILFVMALFGLWELGVLIFGERNLPHIWVLVDQSVLALRHHRILAARRDLPPGLAPHVLATLLRSIFVIGCGYILGLAAAVVAFLYRPAHIGLGMVIDFTRSIPPLLFIPIFVIFTGINEASLLTSATVYSMTAVATFSDAALAAMDRIYLEQARLLQMGTWQTAVRLLVPFTALSIRGGLQVTIALSVGIVLVVEYFIGGVGLGRVLTLGLYSNNTEIIFISLVWATLIVVFLSALNELALGLALRRSPFSFSLSAG